MADNVEIQGIEFEIIGETKEAIEGFRNVTSGWASTIICIFADRRSSSILFPLRS